MKKEFVIFKQEMDVWVKDLSRKLDIYKGTPTMIDENMKNIDHNYELMQGMKTEIDKLRDEISALRMIQILSLKSEIQKSRKI
ncbi:MAG: hypothetical protein KAK00_03415 [Nanoarchaeota archaeon]|nr:hypothetical protein [Nanoarchaeota archaeon]